MLSSMQTRDELYDVLGYHDYERKLDAMFAREPETEVRSAKPVARSRPAAHGKGGNKRRKGKQR
jgi:hypothetical protein